jgi:hypothetical protein
MIKPENEVKAKTITIRERVLKPEVLRIMKWPVAIALLLIAAGAAADSLQTDFWKPPGKKLIFCGWATPGTEFLRKNISTMEKFAPYDGIRINISGTGEGKDQNVRTIFGKTKWKYE